MMHSWVTPALLGVTLLVVVGCKNKAAQDYARCEQLDSNGDRAGAIRKCEAAVADDEHSKAGQAAIVKLRQFEAEAAASAQAAANARAGQAAALRSKISKKYYDTDKDPTCTGKGLPPYRWDYAGGTFDEDALVARADGCQPLRYTTDTIFCCPLDPNK